MAVTRQCYERAEVFDTMSRWTACGCQRC